MTDFIIAGAIGLGALGNFWWGYFIGKGAGRLKELKRQAKAIEVGMLCLDQVTRDSIMADMLIHDPHTKPYDWE